MIHTPSSNDHTVVHRSMNPKPDLDTLPGLSPELAELDAELARFTAEERPSFAPELAAELEREWLRGPLRIGTGRLARRVVAAAVVTLVLAGSAVPPARASLATGLQRLLDSFQTPEPSASDALPAGAAAPDPVMGLPAAPSETSPSVERATGSGAEPVGVDARDGLPAFRPSMVTYPELVDPSAESEAIRRHYPPELQKQGIGGTVRLLLWVGEDGSVANVQTRRNSGVPALDRAAMQAAGSLRFRPATRRGVAVGTYVELDLVFEPVAQPGAQLPPVPIFDPELPPGQTYEIPAEGPLTVSVPTPIQMEARELLLMALGGSESALAARLGPLDGLLMGEPPAGVSPMRWRADAAGELERAMAEYPDNPAPVLALARIRRKQGLRAEARQLFERGLERTNRGTPAVSPRLVAELSYELGSIVRESWLGWAGLGTVPSSVLDGLTCSRPSASSPIEALVARNYLCPAALGEAMASSFQPADGGEAEHRAMLDQFATAVAAFPAHVGANVAILLDEADRGSWTDVLDGARRFAWATQGHPYSLLLTGLALHRLGYSEEALDDFQQAFDVLGAPVESAFRDTRVLGATGAAGAAGAGSAAGFWAGLDPILGTEVNEREVEHLARGAYTYLRFGSLESDAARLWLRYGRPRQVRTFGTADLRTEFWDYGEGPDLTLSRPASSDVRTFTPEAEAYLDDLLRVFPHWYGTRARPVFSLLAQTARFRGDQAGTGALEVSLDVPEALDVFVDDSLDLGVFHLAADGSVRSATIRRIAPDPARVRTEVAADVAWVVVELYNPRSNEAASVRLPAFRGEEADEDPRISDLMLVAADAWQRPALERDSDGVSAAASGVVSTTRRGADAGADVGADSAGSVGAGGSPGAGAGASAGAAVRAGASAGAVAVTNAAVTNAAVNRRMRVSPLARRRVDRPGDVGLYFELYSLPASSYRLRAELESETTGEVMALAFRPEGEMVFETEWTRHPVLQADRVVESLTLDLGYVLPDVYTLRVTASFDGANEVVVGTLGGLVLRSGSDSEDDPR